MEIKQAGLIDFSAFRRQEGVNQLCEFAESLDIGISDEYIYHARDGTALGLDVLVRQAEWANVMRTGWGGATSIAFILAYLDSGFIPFSVFNNAAIMLAKKYQTKYNITIDEKTAMAAVLMVSVGYERMKLSFLRKMIEKHNRQTKQNADGSAPVRGLAPAHLYAKYHIDLLEVAQNKIVQAYQIERNQSYFDVLQYKKEAAGNSLRQQHLIDKNRVQLNLFLDDYAGCHIFFLTYQKKESGSIHILLHGEYSKVDPIAVE